MDSGYNELNRYFRMYKTIIQMLHDRGYILEEDKIAIYEEDINFEAFQTTFSETFKPDDLNFFCDSSNPEAPRIMVRFDVVDPKITGKIITGIVSKMKSDNISNLILVVRDGSVSGQIAKLIDKLRSDNKMKIEFFEQKEILINITYHDLVPKHEPLTKEQKEELLNRYQINESQLPKILRTDPVARYFGVDPGTVMKITRKSETAGRYITYRLVC